MHPVIHSPVRRDVALHPAVSLEGKNCRSSLTLSCESYVSNWARTGSGFSAMSMLRIRSLLGVDDEFSIEFYAFKTVVPCIYIHISSIESKRRE